MNCREIEEFAPLYLSGEMDPDQRARFQAHLAQCRSCQEELNQQVVIDARFREALSGELPDARSLDQSVRGRISAQRARQSAIWGAAAAVLMIGAVLGYRGLRPVSAARLYADAALDHRLEVIEHQPRRWRTDPADLKNLAARYQLSDLAGLAPAGYRLEHAKMCGIGGRPALHLVYTNGAREVSVFVRARSGTRNSTLRSAGVGSEHLAAFETDRLEAVVATDGTSGECLAFAQFISRVL
jgi:anti-sigma factor RsiW